MADEVQYASGGADSNKRKYDDHQSSLSPGRRPTGFSSPPESVAPPSYNSVPPPMSEIEFAKQRAQEIAARLVNTVEATKRARVENGAGGFDSNDGNKGFLSAPSGGGQKPMGLGYGAPQGASYGYPGPSKKIEIPNGRVGVIIGKGGETIKYLQLQSGAKIQVTRDMDADPNSATREVELMGTEQQIAKAEQLINDVLSEAEAGGSGIVSRRVTGPPSGAGAEQFVMQIPNNKVGLVIGKGGETIKNMQARSGARIQVIPLHLPPGDTSLERTLQIDGTSDQIEAAKQLVNEVISENRVRNQSMTGGYPQQGYQARPPTGWGQPNAPMQQSGYGYVQPGAYPGPPQYNQPPYPGYPPQPTSGAYGTGWDQTNAPPSQQNAQGGGYDYYNQQQAPQQQQQQQAGGPGAPTDNSGYGYNQPPAYSQGQAYSQDGYGGYQAPPHSGYGQAPPSGYDQQHQGYGSSYGNVSNPTPDGSYGSHSDGSQAPPPSQSSAIGQQGYNAGGQPSPNTSYASQGSTQPGYGVPQTSQSGYGTQPPAGYGGYGAPPSQKPLTSQPTYGQPQQSPSAQGSYGQPPVQSGYPHSQPPPSQSGYAATDSSAQRPPASGYPTSQAGYGASPYAAPPSYGQQQPPPYSSAYGGAYSQPPYSTDGPSGGAAAAPAPASARGTYDAAPASQTPQPNSAAKASPPES